MAKRWTKKSNNKSFKKNQGVHKMNTVNRRLMRGGIRL